MAGGAMWSGDGYDFLMGRWSQLMAPLLVAFAGVKDGDEVLDVGCGTGSLTHALLDSGPAVKVTGIDGSADYIGIARKKFQGNSRANLQQADAQVMPFADNSFDRCVSLLVMNFVPDASKAVMEMSRVTRPDGTIAAAVWDYGDGMEMLRHLWDEASAIDENAVTNHEGNMPLCRQGELAELWKGCGLKSVKDSGLTIRMDFSSFDDYWAPFSTGIGPSGSYVKSLDAETQTRLRQRLLRKLTGGNGDAPFSLRARAWAVTGEVAK